jgi:hypothetical protein
LSTRFIETPKTKVVHELPEALVRKRKVCERIHQAYIFNRTTDKNILETSVLAQKYPEMIRDSLLTIARVKLIPGVFELDESETIDTKFGTKEGLVWSVARRVMDVKNPSTVALSHCTIKEGVYQSPRAAIELDDDDRVIKSEIKFWQNVFYIPFSKEKAMEVIKEHNGIYRNTVCAQAIERGDHWNTGKTWNIPNLQEWLEIDWDTLVSANQVGVLTESYGGHVRFLKEESEKRKRLEADVALYTSSNGAGKTKTTK